MTHLQPSNIAAADAPGSILTSPGRDRLRPALTRLVGKRACQRLLDSAGEAGVLNWRAAELAASCGIARKEAERVVAARELSASRQPIARRPLAATSDVAAHLPKGFATWETEAVVAIALSRAMQVQALVLVASGGACCVALEARDVFAPLVRLRAFGFILAHNHPGGSPTPSEADVALTNRLSAAGRVLDMELVDHVIVASGGTFSLRDAGLLPTDSELDADPNASDRGPF